MYCVFHFFRWFCHSLCVKDEMDYQKWATPKKLINFLYCVLVVIAVVVVYVEYRKIPKISPGAYIFQRLFLRGLFWRGLYSEGLIYGGKFVFQNRLG